MNFIKAELYKLSKLKKSYLAIIGMNLIPIIVLLITLYLITFKSEILKGSMGMGMMYSEKAKKAISLTFFAEIYSISLASLLFMSMIIGEMISKEFSSGTIKLLLTQPVKRCWLFFYKFSSLIIFYLISISIGYMIMLLNGLILYTVDHGFIKIVNFSSMWKIALTFIVLDISYIAFVSLIASFSPSIEITISLSIMVYIMMKIADAVLYAGNKVSAFGELAKKIAPYTYTNSTTVVNSYDKIKGYIEGLISTFPVNTDLLMMNGMYSLIFFLIGMVLFLRREN